MDPQTAAIIQALSGGAQGAGPASVSPFSPQTQQASQAAAQQAYALPQAAPMQPPGAGQDAAMGDMGGASLGAGNMYQAMMQPPPAPNYWAQ
jgi:hypothetical protein